MSKRTRQYIGIVAAILAYYIIHEGAHLITALISNTFRQINFMGIGIQIDVYAEEMNNVQMGVFCLAGTVSTLIAAWLLIAFRGKISSSKSPVFRAAAYYTTAAMMFIDPLYLSVLCSLFGGGDMNGISLLLPILAARILFGIIGLLHIFAFVKLVLPAYQKAIKEI
ncbi:MAG: hypothetical protein Q4C12_01100 [Clostridia bacterium]|nr:hypothetical protein [Clostridia bacterium]